MALRRSTGLVQKMLQTSDYKTLFTNAVLTLYSGSQPATADLAASGTKLLTITGITWGTAVAGVLDIASALQGTALADGTFGWYRLNEVADNPDNASTTLGREDGTVATSGGQLNMPGGTNVLSGATVDVSAFPVTLPKA